MTAAVVEIYTTPTCPDCRALKAWLDRKGVRYVEHDLTDPAVAEEAKRRTGVRVAPVTLIGDRVFHGPFPDQRPGIAAALGHLANPRR
jgi:glutaredoxin